MILKLINNTAVAKSYAGGAVTLAATIGATATVAATNQLATAVDGNLFSDVSQNNVTVSDNVNTFVTTDGLVYLDRIVRTQASVNDAAGTAITSTLINSKQRLDVNLSSEAADGTTAPFTTVQVGGKDGNGNIQTFLTDTNGNQIVLLKDANGNNIISYNSQLEVIDALVTTGSQGALTVGTSATLASANGTSNLTNRKSLTVYNNGTAIIYWGYTNAVTTSTGTPILPFQFVEWNATSTTSIYLISGTAGQNVRITEGG